MYSVKKEPKREPLQNMKREYTPQQKQNHIYRLLGAIDSKLKAQFQYDELAITSITQFDIADDISAGIINAVKQQFPNKENSQITVLDAFACVGGNTMSFCRHGLSVSAVELNTERFKMLEHNLAIFGYNANLYNENALKIIAKRSGEFNAVFIDVPWDNCIDGILYVGEHTLHSIVEMCLAPVIVLKLPTDYSTAELMVIKGVKISAEIYDEPYRMMIITITRY